MNNIFGLKAMFDRENISIEFDPASGDFFTYWSPPVALGAGATAIEAVEDMRAAIHLCIDTLLDLKVDELNQ